MRVVLDARHVGPGTGGIAAYVVALGRRLAALAPGDRFRFWTNPRVPALFPPAPNLELHPVAAPSNGLRTRLLPALLDRLDGDQMVHFPANLLGHGIPGPTVVTIHDVMWLRQPDYVERARLLRSLRRPFYVWGIGRALARATRLITVSEASAAEILAVAPEVRPRLRVIHLGSEARFRPPERPADARARAVALLGSEAPYFLVLGLNQPYKGHDVALRAFAGAARPGERLVLGQRQFTGRGLHHLSNRLGLGDRIVWKQRVSEEDIVTLFQAATALVQPSLAEGFGLPVLEAMACGCPVIASDIPPLREVLGGAGLLSPPGDPAALSLALRKVADDPALRDELRQRGLERARSFSWDRTAKETLEVYREAARAGSV